MSETRLPWFEFQSSTRKPWRFFFVAPITWKGSRVYGLTELRNRCVIIDCTTPARIRVKTSWHELFHVICHESRSGKSGGELENMAEEDMAELFGSSAESVFGRLGFHLPPLPDGFRAFQRQCRGQQEVVDL